MRTFLQYLFSVLFFLLPFVASASVCAINLGAGSYTDYAPVGNNTNNLLRAQTFTPATSCDVTGVGSPYSQQGSPSSLGVSIYSNISGQPGLLLTSGSAVSGFGSSPAWATSTFSGYALSAATPYWIVWTPPSISGSNYFIIHGDDTSSPLNTAAAYNGTSWSYSGSFWYFYEIDGTIPSPPPPVAGVSGTDVTLAFSTLGLTMALVAGYFAVFWFLMFIVFLGIAWVWRAVAILFGL